MELKGEQERIEVIQGSAEYSGFFFLLIFSKILINSFGMYSDGNEGKVFLIDQYVYMHTSLLFWELAFFPYVINLSANQKELTTLGGIFILLKSGLSLET